MIVLDASVVVELLTNGTFAESLRTNLAERNDSVIAPQLLDAEVVSAVLYTCDEKLSKGHRARVVLFTR